MESVVTIKNVTKTASSKVILKDLNLLMQQGKICGLVGPNGAGKTTLMKLILNITKADCGSITILGETLTDNSYKYLKDIGSLIEQPTFSLHLSGWENLILHGKYIGFYNKNRIEEVLAIVGLTADKNMLVKKYSMGMKQRLGIAKAILVSPKLLMLDEPINGLDPAGIKEICNLFLHLAKKENITILISSHILSELEQIADSIAIINKGELLEHLTIGELSARSTSYYELETTNSQAVSTFLYSNLGLSNCRIIDESTIRIYDQTVSYSDLLQAFAKEDFTILSFETKKTRLEDYYFSETAEDELPA